MTTAIRFALLLAWIQSSRATTREALSLLARELAESDTPLELMLERLQLALDDVQSTRAEALACLNCARARRQIDELRGRLVWERLARRARGLSS